MEEERSALLFWHGKELGSLYQLVLDGAELEEFVDVLAEEQGAPQDVSVDLGRGCNAGLEEEGGSAREHIQLRNAIEDRLKRSV